MNDNLDILKLYAEASPQKVAAFNGGVQSSYTVSSNYEKVEVDFEWLELMEETVIYLDNILRNPNRFIVNNEEIVKVEQARKITVESIKHLSKHTNFIQEIDKNGDVKPSKILNINKDESYNTYENRLIYTLIQDMRIFIDFRKKNLVTSSYTKDHKKSEYHGIAKVGAENVDINVTLNTKLNTNQKYGKNDDIGIEQRIEKLEQRISDLTNTQVYKDLARAHVARVIPPVKKTNLILKNVNFQYAMKLWDYLKQYQDNSDKNTKSKTVYKDDKKLKQMFDDVFLLNYLVVNSLSVDKTFLKDEQNKEVIEKLTNNMINKIVEINSDLPVEEIEKIIGDKLSIIKNKKHASIEEIEQKFNCKIQSIVSKIINFSFR